MTNYEELEAKSINEQLDWIFNTGMNNCDVIPDWVWTAAVVAFKTKHNLPPESINTGNFPSLSRRNATVPTLAEIKAKVL